MKAMPNLVELNKIEEQLIKARLDATRAAISHAGEKGRTLERGVANILRAMLPAEYGLSTGIVFQQHRSNADIQMQAAPSAYCGKAE